MKWFNWKKHNRLKKINSCANDVAIIGLACRFPGAENYQQYWHNLTQGVNSICEITPDRWNINQFYSSDGNALNKSNSKWGGLLDHIQFFDNQFFNISPREAQMIDPQQRLLLEETWHCIEDAGITLQQLQRYKTAVYVGITTADYHQAALGADEINSFACLGNYKCIAANRISYFLGLKGESVAIDTACSSSLVALHHAKISLNNGSCDYAIAAGVSVICHPWKYISVSKANLLSPDGQCKTFDKDANGYVPGEGVGVVLLTTLEKALKYGHRIYGILKGSAVNHNGQGRAITAPNVEAQRELILEAQRSAGICAEEITYIEAHGTGTSLGDPIEIEALTKAFQQTTQKQQYCGIGTVKTNIGHLEAAAGIAGVIKVLLMLQHKKLVPSLNVTTINPLIDFEHSPFFISQKLMEWAGDKRYAGVSSYGFGGVNSHIILEEYQMPDAELSNAFHKPTGYPFLLTAKTSESLQALIVNWRNYITTPKFQQQRIEDISHTLLRGREMLPYRLGFWVNSLTDLAQQLQALNNSYQSAKPASVSLLFINSSIQINYENFIDLCQQNLLVRKHYEICCNTLAKLKQARVIKQWRRNHTSEFSRSLLEAVALYCCSCSLLDLGLTPQLVSGTGVGRVIAAAISGYLSLSDALRVVWVLKKNNMQLKEILLNFKSPHLPYYDSYKKQIINFFTIDTNACQKLRQRLYTDYALLEQIKTHAQLLQENQFTFKQYLEEWDKALRQEAGFSLGNLWDKVEDASALLLQVILLTSFKKLQSKWQLTNKLENFPAELTALVELSSSEILPFNLIIAWLLRSDETSCQQLANLLQRYQQTAISSQLAILFAQTEQVTEHSIDAQTWLTVEEGSEQEFLVDLPNAIVNQSKTVVVGTGINFKSLLQIKNLASFSSELIGLWSHGLLGTGLCDAFSFQGKIIILPSYPFMQEQYWFNQYQTSNAKQVIKINENSMQKTMHVSSQQKLNLKQLNDLQTLTFDNTLESTIENKAITLKNNKNSLNEVYQLTIKPEVCMQTKSTQDQHKAIIETYLGQTDATKIKDHVLQKLKTILAEALYLSENKLVLDKNFVEMGLDSILSVELIRKINQLFHLNLPATKLYDYSTLESLSSYISNQQLVFEETTLDVNNQLTVESNCAELPQESTGNIQSRNQNIPNASCMNPENIATPVQQASSTDIAIIGMAGQFPGAKNLQEFWNNLAAGISSITEVSQKRWKTAEFYHPKAGQPGKTYSKWGGFLEDVEYFDPLFFNISPGDAEWMDPQQRLLLQTVWAALEDAGYSTTRLSNTSCGVYVGVMNNDYAELITRSKPTAQYFQQIMGSSNAILAARISYLLNLKGPAITVDTACSSSLVAIHLACKALQAGEVKMMLAGGVTLYLTETPYLGMSEAGMLSPTGDCKTFDDAADGFVPGEGVGVIVLKRLEDALRDNDIVYGVIKGSGINQDGKTNGITAPSVLSQQELELSIYQRYQINPATISYVEAHGTGTKLGDPIEVEALTTAFRSYTDKKNYCAIGSIKTNIGHTSAAAGVASVIKTLLCLQHKKLVPSLHFNEPNEHINFSTSPFYVNTTLKNWDRVDNKPLLAAVSSFGFSGTNAHLVIEEGPKYISLNLQVKTYYLLTLSAKHQHSLQKKVEALHDYLQKHSNLTLEAVAYTLNAGRSHFNYRCALIVSSLDDLQDKLKKIGQKQKISDYFYGEVSNVDDDKSIYLKILQNALEELIISASSNIENYKKNLETLGNLYVKGYQIDWNLLHAGETKQYISLPTYPFLKESYWIPQAAQSISQSNHAILHPLIGENTSNLLQISFKTIFKGNEFYLKDHIVAGQKILPGVAYLEMAKSAGEIALPGSNIKEIVDIVWTSPIVVTEKEKAIQLHLEPIEQGKIRYNLSSFDVERENVHGQGTLIFGDNEDLTAWSTISRLENQLKQTYSKKQFYQYCAEIGLDYGETFQTLQWVKTDGNEALGYYELSSSFNHSESYSLHPGVLDGALQTSLVLNLTKNKAVISLPFALEKFSFCRVLPLEGFIHIRLVSNNSQCLEIQILNKQGEVCIQFKNLSIRPVTKELIEESDTLCYYQSNWEKESLSITLEQLQTVKSLCVISDDLSLGDHLKNQFPDLIILQLIQGTSFTALGNQQYQLRLNKQEDYFTFIEEIRKQKIELSHFILDQNLKNDIADVSLYLNTDLQKIVVLIQALMQQKSSGRLRFVIPYIEDKNLLSPIAMLVGFAKSLYQENPLYQVSIIGFNRNLRQHDCYLLFYYFYLVINP